MNKTLTVHVPIQPTLGQTLNNQAWNYIYSTRTGNTCDETLNNNVAGGSRMYINGNLCLGNNVTMSPTALIVKGNLTLNNNVLLDPDANEFVTKRDPRHAQLQRQLASAPGRRFRRVTNQVTGAKTGQCTKV